MKRTTLKAFYFLLLNLATLLYFMQAPPAFGQEPGRGKRSGEEKKKSTIEALFIEANRQKILGNLPEAAKLFYQCLDKDPQNDASMFELGKIFREQKNLKDALEFAKKAASADPDNVWYQLFLADLYEDLTQYDHAADVYEKLVKRNPESIDYYYQWANALIFDGEYSDALKILDQIENKVGVNEDLSMQKEKIYLHMNKPEKAADEIRNLISKFPGEPKYYAILAELYMSQNQPEKAIGYYQKILEISPNDPFIHISLADYYRKTGDKARAFEELKTGFSNPALDIDMKIQILLTYYTITDIYDNLKDQAYALVDILVRVHPNNPKAHSINADFLMRDKKYAEAREEFRTVIRLDSSRYVIWEQLLRLDGEMNDLRSLLSEGRRAIELFPEQPLPYYFCGIASYQTKDYPEAIRVLKQGVGYVVDNQELESEFWSTIGEAYNQEGDHVSSDEAYEKSVLTNPDNALALNNYAYYLTLRGKDLDKAERMAQKAVEKVSDNSSYQDTYGWVFYKLGKFREAEEWLRKALASSGDSSAVILEHYGDVMYKLDQKDKAVEYWEKALKTGKGSEFLEKKATQKRLFE